MVPSLVQIYYLSDFTIQVELPESYESGDFRYTIYTCGDITNGWEASYVNGQRKNCTIDGRIVTIYVDTTHTLKPGCVTIQSEFPEKNYHFEDNVENIKSNYKTNIYLVTYRTNSFSAMWKPSLSPDLSGDSDVVKEDQLEYELGFYVTKEELSNASYTTYATMEQYVAEHAAEEVDLTMYVSKDELSAAGYITTIPSEYVTDTELQSALEPYVTEQELSAMSFVDSSKLDITLEEYAKKVDLLQYTTTSQLTTTLGAYPTKSELQTTLASYVTEAELSAAGYAREASLGQYVTKQELSGAGYLTQHQSLDSYATKDYVDNKVDSIPQADMSLYALKTDLNAYITEAELSGAGYVQASNLKTINGYGLVGTGNISITAESGAVDLSKYVTKQELNSATYVTKQELDNAGYLTSIPSDYITEQELSSMSYITTQEANSTFAKEADMSNVVTKQELSAAGYLTSVPSNYVTDGELASSLNDYAQVTDLLDYVTDSQLVTTLSSYASKVYVEDRISQIQPTDTSGLVSKQELSQMGYITAIPSEYVTDTEMQSALEPYVTQTELSANGYVTKSQLTEASYVTQYQLNQAGYLTAVPSNYATKEYVDDKVAEIPQPDLSDYVTKEDINAAGYLTAVPSNYATKEYVDDKIADIPQVDLSTYVTKQELSGASYVTSNELSQAGYITSIPDNYITSSALESSLEGYATKDEINAAGYLTAVPSNYATKDYVDGWGTEIESAILGPAAIEEITQQMLSSAGYITSIPSEYVTQTELSANGYLTSIPSNYATKTYVADYVAQNAPTPDLSAYVTKSQLTEASYVSKTELNAAGYITSADLPAMPTIDESIIPNTTNTYTLGDSTHMYSAAYASNIKLTSNGKSSISANSSSSLRLAPDDVGFYLEKNGFRPGTNGNKLLGTSSAQWGYTYSANFIENGTNIKDIYATKTYVADYVAQNAPTPDMSAYVTKAQLSAAGYITSAVFMYDSTTNSLTIRI